MSGRCVVHVAEIIPGPGLPDPLRVPREPVPAAAGGAVGHLTKQLTLGIRLAWPWRYTQCPEKVYFLCLTKK